MQREAGSREKKKETPAQERVVLTALPAGVRQEVFVLDGEWLFLVFKSALLPQSSADACRWVSLGNEN